MTRIHTVDPTSAEPELARILAAVRSPTHATPHHLRVLANSKAALQAFLGLSVIADGGALSVETRVRIALAIAQRLGNAHSLGFHTAVARQAGLTGNEIAANREGASENARAAVALRLALSLSEHMGAIDTAELVEARVAGYTDADIVEIITHVGMGQLIAMINKASGVEPDNTLGLHAGP
ncbi:MAG TPA: carboxymuconolactone decarboxylase family protein [Burkholderiaceae bacterium]|nr:carboxymuconolactone decarboxylase family protein [Burkholderiaceae bacterium]